MITVYRSKIDVWVMVVLVIAIIVSLFPGLTFFLAPSPIDWLTAVFTAIFGAGLPLWLLLSTRYTLGNGHLVVQSGPFKWHIPVAEITNITPTSSPVSGPALSLDRLRIDYGGNRSLMISPRDQEQFVRDIRAANQRGG